jgi:hypothetical protein
MSDGCILINLLSSSSTLDISLTIYFNSILEKIGKNNKHNKLINIIIYAIYFNNISLGVPSVL